ncbi:MAG TPA: hypothetical protein DCM07_26645 [Planctomycetaceae bacterium]|nr:hypothetical protein [Gimesia sp.]HAH48359.1 hypothetical protein [Planctomycetaceae bacterium]HBL42874.1 hypothetical protein [Planctomycetaceae bacterium]
MVKRDYSDDRYRFMLQITTLQTRNAELNGIVGEDYKEGRVHSCKQRSEKRSFSFAVRHTTNFTNKI